MSSVRIKPLAGAWSFTLPGDRELELATARQGANYMRADRLQPGELVRHAGELHRVVAIAGDDGVVRRLIHRTAVR